MHVAFGVFRVSDGFVRSGRASESPAQSSAVLTSRSAPARENHCSAAAANFERLFTDPKFAGRALPALERNADRPYSIWTISKGTSVDIDIVWRTPVRLQTAPAHSSQDFVIKSTDAERVPEGPGLYVFARKHGAKFEPIYVGQADNLKKRLGQHLKQNVALMRALKSAKSGTKVVLLAELNTKKGQQVARVLNIVEPTLIAEAVAAGYSLVNKQLTN